MIGERTEGLVKLAVTIDDLRKATDALKRHTSITRGREVNILTGELERASKSTGNIVSLPPKVRPDMFIDPKMMALSRMYSNFSSPGKRMSKFMNLREPQKELMAAGVPEKGMILEATEPYKLLSGLGAIDKDIAKRVRNNKKARETLNRFVLLHEGTELRTALRNKNTASFASHLNIGVPLNDLNIAATLRGPGSREASEAIYSMRKNSGEVKDIASLLGKKEKDIIGMRFSRHAKKNIDKLYKEKMWRESLKEPMGMLRERMAANKNSGQKLTSKAAESLTSRLKNLSNKGARKLFKRARA